MGDIFDLVDYVVQIQCDNKSIIRLVSNPVFHTWTKHIEVRNHYIREKMLDQEIELKGISTNVQVTAHLRIREK